jgi:hypothetical protein
MDDSHSKTSAAQKRRTVRWRDLPSPLRGCIRALFHRAQVNLRRSCNKSGLARCANAIHNKMSGKESISRQEFENFGLHYIFSLLILQVEKMNLMS